MLLFLCLTVIDTAGQEEFAAMREHYLRVGHGFLIVYSVTDEESFKQVPRFHKMILRSRDCVAYPMMLIANKIDLHEQRQVSHEDGVALAKELGVCIVSNSILSKFKLAGI